MSNIKTDVLIVGSGLAGTLLSLELAKKRPDLSILILTGEKKNSSSYLAQGGIAAVIPDTEDTIEQHIQDTMAAGAYANDRSVVNYFVSKSPEAIQALENWNIIFDRDAKGTKALALEGGHSLPRVLHHKDFTGKHIMQQLHSRLKNYQNIRLLEGVKLFDLIKSDLSDEIVGAHVWDHSSQKTFSVQAAAVILSTGGVGGLFRYTTNPSTATGQGIALAEKAGASISDLINIQFHPTAFWQPSGSHLPLISEALRGAGAVLKNEAGYKFMAGQHRLNDLAPRDVVARNIIKEIKGQKHPYVFLDGTFIKEKEWRDHFPGILKICENFGLDPRKDLIPVVPAAHYSCGGIKADIKGSTDINRLYVIGESACTGLHGANRLASNSLLEATVMAISLAEHLSAGVVENNIFEKIPTAPKLTMDELSQALAENFVNEIQDIMQQYCGVVKTTSGLQAAAQSLNQLEDDVLSSLSPHSYISINLQLSLYTAKRIVEESLKAKENRGVFYNQDLVKSSIFR